MIRKVCIITPGTIASNPRVVKEAEALSEAGYKVHLIYTRHVDYLIKQDEEILKDHPEWEIDYLDWASPGFQYKIVRFISGLQSKAASLLLKSGLYRKKAAGFLLNRFYSWQLKKAIASKADLYIAHYPGSLGIAAEAATINKGLFAYDAEDFHRGEDLPKWLTEVVSVAEGLCLPTASYISAASPLIADAYQKLYPLGRLFTIENMFPLKRQQPFLELNTKVFKFFWFSQTVGPKRGLEEFISILGLAGKINIQLTLLGNCAFAYQNYLQKLWAESHLPPALLKFVKTVPEKEIFELAAEHHFGLALEVPDSLNRDICLTNKLYTYILSGNTLIVSNTQAQKQFLTTYPTTGICIDFKNQAKAATEILNLMNGTDLNNKRLQIYELGRETINFDSHKAVLLENVNNLWD